MPCTLPMAQRATAHEDFRDAISFPAGFSRYEKIGFFPGSTIGNLTPHEAVLLLRQSRNIAPNGSSILGLDLKKDPELLLRAYDDFEGVTAAFNLHLLERINRELTQTSTSPLFSIGRSTTPRKGASRCTWSAGKIRKKCYATMLHVLHGRNDPYREFLQIHNRAISSRLSFRGLDAASGLDRQPEFV